MDAERIKQLIKIKENQEALPDDHSGFEHYSNHADDDEDDTLLRMVLEAQ